MGCDYLGGSFGGFGETFQVEVLRTGQIVLGGNFREWDETIWVEVLRNGVRLFGWKFWGVA